MNLLSQRIKEAKRELTALKTAHRKGLGLLKIYSESYNIPAPSSQDLALWLVINYTFSVSPYPFVQNYFVVNDISDTITAAEGEIEYKNNGNTVEFRIPIWNDSYKIMVQSTSPISSMTYYWRNLNA